MRRSKLEANPKQASNAQKTGIETSLPIGNSLCRPFADGLGRRKAQQEADQFGHSDLFRISCFKIRAFFGFGF